MIDVKEYLRLLHASYLAIAMTDHGFYAEDGEKEADSQSLI